MDNIRNHNVATPNSNSSSVNHKFRSKILPIYIVKKDVTNTRVLSRKQVSFQVNFGNVYRIDYKYFTPKGFHLADNSSREVTCRYNNNGLNVNSVTFIYVENNSNSNGSNNDKSSRPKAQPIRVNYLDVSNSKQLTTGLVRGQYGQSVNVLDRISLPSGFILCNGQTTVFKINNQIQTVNLMVKPIQDKAQAINQSKSSSSQINQSVNDKTDLVSTNLTNDIQKSVSALKTDLRKYDCDLAVQLVHEVLHHNLDFFKKVIASLFSKMKYKDINNLKIDSQNSKISGVIKKYLFNNNQVNFTFVRAKKYDIHHQVSVSEVRDFVTSVIDHNSSKGVFITTSNFDKAARKEAERHSIILIDNMKMARLMIDHNVGVKSQRIFRVVSLDKDFF